MRSNMRKILILTTGGTIASVQSPDGLTPGITSEQLRGYLPQIGADIDIDIKELFHIDSTDMMADKAVLGFFTSLMQLANLLT